MKLVIVGVMLFCLSIVAAAPAPWGIAINDETQECINFWPGDEFSTNELPGGFIFYDLNDVDCDVDWNAENDYRECCEQLGLTFVDESSLDKGGLFDSMGGYYTLAGVLIIAVLLIWFFSKKKK